MDDSRPKSCSFGPFKIDLEQRLLFRAGDLVPLTPNAFDTLAVLVARQGKVIDKAELLRLVWPDTFVEENNLTQNISALRKVLGGDYIETIPRRGYRFLTEAVDLAATPQWSAIKSRPDCYGEQGPGSSQSISARHVSSKKARRGVGKTCD